MVISNQIEKKKIIGHRLFKKDISIFAVKIMSILTNRVNLSFHGILQMLLHNTSCLFWASESMTQQREYVTIALCTETIGGLIFKNSDLFLKFENDWHIISSWALEVQSFQSFKNFLIFFFRFMSSLVSFWYLKLLSTKHSTEIKEIFVVIFVLVL